jgi:hypothetical protein
MDFLGKLMGAFGKKPSWDATVSPEGAFFSRDAASGNINGLTGGGAGKLSQGLGAFGKAMGEKPAAMATPDAPPPPGADPSAQIATAIMARRGAFGAQPQRQGSMQRAWWMPSR